MMTIESITTSISKLNLVGANKLNSHLMKAFGSVIQLLDCSFENIEFDNKRSPTDFIRATFSKFNSAFEQTTLKFDNVNIKAFNDKNIEDVENPATIS